MTRTLVAVAARDLELDAVASEAFVAAIEAFTPRVEVLRPGACACATRGPSRYFGGDHALAAKIVNAAPVACAVGIAEGVFAAELAARSGTVVPPGCDATAAFLASFPVAELGDADFADLLRRLGIRTLGDLAALPASSVAGRFGATGAIAHRLACGVDVRALEPRQVPPDLVVAAEIDPPADRVDTLAFTAKAMAEDLSVRLRDRALAAEIVAVEAETEHGEQLCRLWRFDAGVSAPAMAERVRWQLDGWLSGSAASRPTAGITRLRLVAEQVAADRGRQLGFWGGDQATDERAARALARVQGMLGPDAVQTATLVGGRSPADRVALHTWGEGTGPTPGPPADREAPWPGAVPAPAPATVYVEPLAAEVVDTAGAAVVVTGRASASASPARLSIAGSRWVEVTAWAGPWPVDECWWDPPAHRRRARWQLVTAEGDAHLAAVESGRWVVEATYD